MLTLKSCWLNSTLEAILMRITLTESVHIVHLSHKLYSTAFLQQHQFIWSVNGSSVYHITSVSHAHVTYCESWLNLATSNGIDSTLTQADFLKTWIRISSWLKQNHWHKSRLRTQLRVEQPLCSPRPRPPPAVRGSSRQLRRIKKNINTSLEFPQRKGKPHTCERKKSEPRGNRTPDLTLARQTLFHWANTASGSIADAARWYNQTQRRQNTGYYHISQKRVVVCKDACRTSTEVWKSAIFYKVIFYRNPQNFARLHLNGIT